MIKLVRWEEVERSFTEAGKYPIESHQHRELVVAQQCIVHVILEHTIHHLPCAVDT